MQDDAGSSEEDGSEDGDSDASEEESTKPPPKSSLGKRKSTQKPRPTLKKPKTRKSHSLDFDPSLTAPLLGGARVEVEYEEEREPPSKEQALSW